MKVTVTGLIELSEVTAATCKLELRAFLILPMAFKKVGEFARLTYRSVLRPDTALGAEAEAGGESFYLNRG